MTQVYAPSTTGAPQVIDLSISPQIDGGTPTSVYGATPLCDGGTP